MYQMINEVVKQCVAEKDISVTRSTLARLAYMADKDSYDEFVESVEYANKELIGLYVADDNRSYEEKPEDKTVYRNIAELLMDNFSEKKVNSVVKVGGQIFSKKPADEATKVVASDFLYQLKTLSKFKVIGAIIVAFLLLAALIKLIQQ